MHRCVGGCRPNPWTHEPTPRPFTLTSPLPPRSPQRASSEHCLETSLLTSLPAVSLSYQFRCHRSVLSPPYIPPGVPVHLLALRLLPALPLWELPEPCARHTVQPALWLWLPPALAGATGVVYTASSQSKVPVCPNPITCPGCQEHGSARAEAAPFKAPSDDGLGTLKGVHLAMESWMGLAGAQGCPTPRATGGEARPRAFPGCCWGTEPAAGHTQVRRASLLAPVGPGLWESAEGPWPWGGLKPGPWTRRRYFQSSALSSEPENTVGKDSGF